MLGLLSYSKNVFGATAVTNPAKMVLITSCLPLSIFYWAAIQSFTIGTAYDLNTSKLENRWYL
jgi:hypothetical protein